MSQKGFAPILIIIIVVAAIGIVGAFYLGRSTTKQVVTQQLPIQSSPTSKPIPILQASSTPSATPDSTANWKTFTNTKYGFTVKYPPVWRTKGLAENNVIARTRFSNSDYTAVADVDIYIDQTSILVEYNQLKEAAMGQKIANEFGYEVKLGNTVIDNYPAVIYSFEGTVHDASFYEPKTILINKNNKIYLLSLGIHFNNDNESKNLFDKLVTTFKFTE